MMSNLPPTAQLAKPQNHPMQSKVIPGVSREVLQDVLEDTGRRECGSRTRPACQSELSSHFFGFSSNSSQD